MTEETALPTEPSKPTIVGVPRETFPGERRVAVVPTSVAPLKKAGLDVLVEPGAGARASFPDDQYTAQGASLAADRAELFAQADIVVQVRAAGANSQQGRADINLLRDGQHLIAMCDPLSEPGPAADIAARNACCFALELLPRITRAQSMDVLSSMATIAGYKAVLLAANCLPRMFPMLMTAAGTITPARVLVVGVGVAGLQAIATARRLGAVVEAYDIRPAVKEQVESLGARFVELALEAEDAETKDGYAREMDDEFYRRQRELMARVVAGSDVVITTAAVPGKTAPVLVTAEMVAAMSPGSVIVDLAAERGGNCELTCGGETVVEHNVTILGPTNLPSDVPYHASQMYSRNIAAFLQLLCDGGVGRLLGEDEILNETLVAGGGEVVHPHVRELLQLPPREVPQPSPDDGLGESVEAATPVPPALPETGEAGDQPAVNDQPAGDAASGTAISLEDKS